MNTPNETTTLIEKLLDGTITPAEKSALDAQIAASPELAEEVNELVKIEDLLKTEAESERLAAPTDFLRKVETTVAATIAAKVVAPQAPAASSGFLSSSFWFIVAGVLTVAGIMLYPILRPATNSMTETSIRSQEEISSKVEQPQPTVSEPVITATEAPKNEQPAKSTEIKTPASNAEEQTSEKSKSAISASADDTEITKSQEQQIQMMKNRLAQLRKVGDKAGEAQHLKQLGLMMRQFRQYDESAQYFEQAIVAAQSSKLPAPEIATMHIEAGNLEKMRNNKEKATQFYRKAASILESNGQSSDDLKRKIQELEK